MAIGQDYDESTGQPDPDYDPYGYGEPEPEDEPDWGTLHDPPATPPPEDTEAWTEQTNRWSYHLANDPYGGAAGAWAKQFYDNPNIDPGAEIQKQIAAFRRQYGDAAPDDDIGVMTMIAEGRRPESQTQNPTQSWTSGGASSGGATAVPPPPPPSAIGQTTQELMNLLMSRARQGVGITRDDPTVRAQVDPYTAQLDRQQRNYLEAMSEGSRGRPFNMQGEQRMAAERFGQMGAQFEGEVIGREIGARRQEIAEALSMWGDLLSEDQRVQLQRELGYLDDATRRYGIDVEMTRAERDRELQEWIARNQDDLIRGGWRR